MTETEQTDPDVDVKVNPKSAKAWLEVIEDAEKAFRDYHQRADNIEKHYADMERLANATRDRQFQLFWANVQVIGPSIYARPPVPVVVPRFKDRQPVARAASELLERSTVVAFELEDIDGVMRAVRDDMVVVGRGCAWVRYEAKGERGAYGDRICIDHVDRKDWLCEPAREWKEVDWTARRSFLTKPDMRKRFFRASGKAYLDASYEERRSPGDDASDGKKKAAVWEIWSKSQDRVVWISEGVDVLLDDGKPHLTLEGFFPCPRPAFATLQRRSLIPVPDFLFYKDQLEEINELTARISALSGAVKVRGFYPAGASELGDAIEAAIKATADNQILVPISNWAMMGNVGARDMIVWLPIEMIVKTITELVALRKQLIDDVYQITGQSDIMRGSTDPNETLGAQELKSQYGSVRIKDKQAELVRFARDLARLSAEIMAENFRSKTLLDMSQMQLATSADVAKQVSALTKQGKAIAMQIEQAKADPEVAAMAQQNPKEAQAVLGQAQQQIAGIRQEIENAQQTVTIEGVMMLLRDQRLRPFALDIETDSTIAPDENAQKQRATEFVTAVGGFMSATIPVLAQAPEAAPVAAEMLKYVAGQFRAGRELQGVIEEMADNIKQAAGKPKPPSPEQVKAEADAKGAQADAADKQATAQAKLIEAQTKARDAETERKVREIEAMDASAARNADAAAKKQASDQQLAHMDAKNQRDMLEHQQRMDLGGLQITLAQANIEKTKVATDATVQKTEAGIQAQRDGTAIKAAQAAEAKEPA